MKRLGKDGLQEKIEDKVQEPMDLPAKHSRTMPN